jgi:hypothetical protein
MCKRGFSLLHYGYEMHGLPSHFYALQYQACITQVVRLIFETGIE